MLSGEKKLFVKSPSYLAHFLFLCLLSVVIMSMDYHYRKLEKFHTLVNSTFYPVLYIAELPSNIKDLGEVFFTSKQSLIEKSAQLRQENTLLKSQIRNLAALEVENHRLRGLLNMSRQIVKEKVLIAKVLKIDNYSVNDTIMIDKGLNDGVYIGQPVLDAEGLLGQIVHVSYNTATVLLVTSTRHAVALKVNRNGYRLTAEGGGKNSDLRLIRVSAGDDIKAGDLLVTSGRGKIFPREYPVATVSSIAKSRQMFVDAHARPLAKTKQVDEIMLVWPGTHDKRRKHLK